MIPQGFRLEIELDNEVPQRFLIVGWIAMGDHFNPVVVPFDGQAATKATILPQTEPWFVVA